MDFEDESIDRKIIVEIDKYDGTRQRAMPLGVRKGLGATLAKDSKDMERALRRWEPRYLVEEVATGTVPAYELPVYSACVGKRLISLRVGDVDGLPRRQDEDLVVKAIRIEQTLELRARKG